MINRPIQTKIINPVKYSILEKLWIIYIFISIAIPLNKNYSILSFFISNNSFNYLDILLIIIMGYCIINFKTMNTRSFLMLFYVLAFVFTLAKGKSLYGYSAFNDSYLYLRVFVIYFIANCKFIKISNRVLFKIIFISMTLNGILNLIFSILYSVPTSGNYNSLYILTLSYGIWDFVNEEKNIPFRLFLIHLLLFFIIAISSGSRTSALLAILSTFLIVITQIKIHKTVLKINKRIFRIFLVAIVIIILIFFVLCINPALILKSGLFDKDISTGTARVNTFIYYLEIFKENLMGMGFGYKMHFLTKNSYVLPQETFQIDNAIIVYAIKGGIFFLVINTIILLKPMLSSYRFKDKFNSIIFIAYPLFLITTAIMNSQIIHGYAVVVVTWTIASRCSINNLI